MEAGKIYENKSAVDRRGRKQVYMVGVTLDGDAMMQSVMNGEATYIFRVSPERFYQWTEVKEPKEYWIVQWRGSKNHMWNFYTYLSEDKAKEAEKNLHEYNKNMETKIIHLREVIE